MGRFERWSMWSTSSLTLLTGLGYAWTKYLVVNDDPWAVVNHPLQPWFLKLHILVAPLMLFAVGTIAVKHIWTHWSSRVRAGRRSGTVSMVVLVPLVLSGYLIQTVTHERLLVLLGLTHLGLGLIFGIGLLLHRVFARRTADSVASLARLSDGHMKGRPIEHLPGGSKSRHLTVHPRTRPRARRTASGG